MKYEKKIQLAKEGLQLLSEGKTLKEINQEFLARDFPQYDLDKVNTSIKKLAVEKFGAEFKPFLLEGDLDSKRENYSYLSDDVFEMIKTKQIKRIIESSKEKVNELVKKGDEEDDIISKVANRFYPEGEVIKQIEFYSKHHIKVSGQEKGNYLALGIVFIIAGIGLSIFSLMNPMGNASTLFYCLIAFGIYNLFKAYSTRGEIENMR